MSPAWRSGAKCMFAVALSLCAGTALADVARPSAGASPDRGELCVALALGTLDSGSADCAYLGSDLTIVWFDRQCEQPV